MIYDNIKKICEAKGLTIREVEKRAGLGNAVIRAWNECSPSIRNLQAVSNVLEVEIKDLI